MRTLPASEAKSPTSVAVLMMIRADGMARALSIFDTGTMLTSGLICKGTLLDSSCQRGVNFDSSPHARSAGWGAGSALRPGVDSPARAAAASAAR